MTYKSGTIRFFKPNSWMKCYQRIDKVMRNGLGWSWIYYRKWTNPTMHNKGINTVIYRKISSRPGLFKRIINWLTK